VQLLQPSDERSYFFRLTLAGNTLEADRLNNAFSGELKEEDDIVLAKERTRLLTLPAPSLSQGSSNV